MNHSLILPVRNASSFIEGCLPNVLSTMGISDELIIIDDNSVDGTSKVLEIYSTQDSRIRVLKNPGDGLVDALNLGIQESSNQWIARCDVDDFYYPHRLDSLSSQIKDDVVAIFSDYQMMTKKGISLGTIPSPIFPAPTSLAFLTNQRTAHSSVIFRKEAVLDAGGYVKADFPAEDLSLWLRMSKLGNLISIPETLMKYRIHGASVTKTRRIQMIEKRLNLIDVIGINSSDVSDCFENLEEYLNKYNGTKMGNQRSLFLIRDLIQISKLTNKVFPKLSMKAITNFPFVYSLPLGGAKLGLKKIVKACYIPR